MRQRSPRPLRRHRHRLAPEALEARWLLAADILPIRQYDVGSSPQAITWADLNGDGAPDFATANSTIGKSGVSVFLNDGRGAFADPLPYATTQAVTAICTADVNADGHPDLIAVVGNGVSIYVNAGNGMFGSPTTYSAASQPAAVTAADLNGDGRPDLAVANSGSGNVSVLLNTATGIGGAPAFGAVTNYPTGATQASGIAAADLNGDGHLDLAVSNKGAANVSVFLNSGGGVQGPVTFATAVKYGVGTSPNAIIAANVDGDANIDLVTANTGSNNISVLRNTAGTGVFGAAQSLAVGGPAYSVVSGDVNADGHTDLVAGVTLTPTGLSANASAVVLPGAGNGAFGTATGWALGVGGGQVSIAVADVNSDAHSDLLSANFDVHCVSVALNAGDGTFVTGRSLGLTSPPVDALWADMNRDGKPDLVTAGANLGGSVTIVLNQGNGQFAPAVGYSISADLHGLTVADVTGDDWPDVIATAVLGKVYVFANDTHGALKTPVPYTIPSTGEEIVAADLNGDTKPDIAIASPSGNNVIVLLNTGSGFATPVPYPVGRSPSAIVAADFDGDGRIDLATPSSLDANVSILPNLGNGAFGAAIGYSVSSKPSTLLAADLNDDGRPDLLTSTASGPTASVLLNAGGGAFNSPVDYTPGRFVSDAIAADVTGDGAPDLVVPFQRDVGPGGLSAVLAVFPNHGNKSGTFDAPLYFALPRTPVQALAADFTGDGAADLAITFSTANAWLIPNRGPIPLASLAGGTLSLDFTGLPIGASGISVGTDGGNLTVIPLGGGGSAFTFPATSVNTIRVLGTPGNDTLNFDAPAGNLLTFDGGAGADTLNVNGGGVRLLGGNTANLAAHVASGATLDIDATTPVRLAGLDIAGFVHVQPGGGLVLLTGPLAIGPTGKLDLADNDFLIKSGNGAPTLDTVRGFVASGFHGGDWTGPGIDSSSAASDPSRRTTVAAASAAQLHLTTFAGQSLNPNDVL
ncbi:MAG TPA: VCBS repeat-containing protein, partial [Tepidisphaeraceae bacterium]